MHYIFGLNDNLSAEEARASKKLLLKDLLSSYADEADIFAEIVQNAFDAVREAWNLKYYDEIEPKLTIYIGKREDGAHYFGVSDNGTGMSPETASKFTTPGFSENKKVGKSVGYKGVGASFFFAASNRITFRTKPLNSEESTATVLNSLNWLNDDTANEPIVQEGFSPPVIDEKDEFTGRGTDVFYYFDSAWKPSSLTHIVKKADDEREIESWAFFLASRTALGSVQGLPFKLKIEFVLDRGDGNVKRSFWSQGKWMPNENEVGYPYPWRVLKVAHDVADINNTPAAQKNKHLRKYQAVKA